MAASANQHQEQSAFNGASTSNPSNGNSAPRQDNSGSMKHNPGIDTDWTAEEQAILEDGLVKYASDLSIVRYAKIAMQLPNKTVREVALRSRWMNLCRVRGWSMGSCKTYLVGQSPWVVLFIGMNRSIELSGPKSETNITDNMEMILVHSKRSKL